MMNQLPAIMDSTAYYAELDALICAEIARLGGMQDAEAASYYHMRVAQISGEIMVDGEEDMSSESA